MIEVIYKSKASADLPFGEVFKIVETSAKNNADHSLTGFLIFAGGQFFQLIEGPSQSIERLLERITADNRHQDIEILSSASVAERTFPKWKMKRLTAEPSCGADALEALDLHSAPAHVTDAVAEFLRNAEIFAA